MKFTGLLIALALASPAQAHRMGLARVSLSQSDETVVTLALNPQAAKHQLRPLPSPGCVIIEPWRMTLDALHMSSSWRCKKDIEQLSFSRQGNYEGTILARLEQRSRPAVERLSRGAKTIYFKAEKLAQTPILGHLLGGLWHLLLGWDHLLLIALLAVHFRAFSPLLGATLAFTAGHTLSLAAAAFGLLNVSIPAIEASIALSLMVMAYETLRQQSQSPPYGLLVAFGLLHGLGLASGFAGAGLDGWALLGAVLLFNLGIELAQLLWLCAVRLGSRALPQTWARDALAYGSGAMAAFWLLQRSNDLGGS
jgi:hydrogenase/urease accessory protein HupE